MKLKSILVTIVGLSLAAVIFAQTSQGSTSQSSSKSGNSQASGRAWSSSSATAGGSKSGFANGFGNGSGFGFNGKPTHVIMYTLESSTTSAEDRQRVFDQHTRYLNEQQVKGKVLLFGPWRDLPGSMAIVVGPSDEEAAGIARNDPAVRSGGLSFEVRAWNVVSPAQSEFPGGIGGNSGSSGNSGGGSIRGGRGGN